MEPIAWNGCIYYNCDEMHRQMYERILDLERLLKERSENDKAPVYHTEQDALDAMAVLKLKNGDRYYACTKVE